MSGTGDTRARFVLDPVSKNYKSPGIWKSRSSQKWSTRMGRRLLGHGIFSPPLFLPELPDLAFHPPSPASHRAPAFRGSLRKLRIPLRRSGSILDLGIKLAGEMKCGRLATFASLADRSEWQPWARMCGQGQPKERRSRLRTTLLEWDAASPRRTPPEHLDPAGS